MLIVSIVFKLLQDIPNIQLGLHHTQQFTLRSDWERNFSTREMISIFPFWTFHLYVYVAAFQQHFNRITIWTIYLSIDTIYQSLRLFLLSIKIPFVTRIADNMDATHDHRCARWTKSHYRPFLFMTYLWIFKMNNNNMPVWRSHTTVLFISWLIFGFLSWIKRICLFGEVTHSSCSCHDLFIL